MPVKFWVVRVVRAMWYRTDYVGCYAAVSACQAMTIASFDPYFRKLSQKRAVRIEAVEAVDLEVANVRDEAGLTVRSDYDGRSLCPVGWDCID